MSPLQALYLFRIVFVGFIVWASARTWSQGWAAPAHGGAHNAAHIQALAAAEIIAALAFLWPAAQLWAGGALVVIFTVATVIDLRLGGAPMRFAYYAATVAIIAYLDLRLKAFA